MRRNSRPGVLLRPDCSRRLVLVAAGALMSLGVAVGGTSSLAIAAQTAPSPSASTTGSAVPGPSRSMRPAAPPAVQDSGVPLGALLLALTVMAGAGVIVWVVHRRGVRVRRASPSGIPRPPATGHSAPLVSESAASADGPAADTMAFLIALGEAMIDSGDPVTHVRETLHLVASTNGLPGAEIIVLPTALVISGTDAQTVQTAVTSAGATALRLDQVDAVFAVVRAAELGEISPDEGIERVRLARTLKPAFPAWARVIGYAAFTVGLALLLQASWTDAIIAGVLGAVIGTLLLWTPRLPANYQVFVPVVCAFGVSMIVFLLARTGLDLGGFAALVAPLVTFLPGALLTTAVIELSTGQRISGAGRLAAGVMQLVLLALGIVAAAQLVGVPATSFSDAASHPLGPLAPWIGVAIFGVGVGVHRCARLASLGWIVLVLYIAYAGQVVGAYFFGDVLSAFVGALVMTPVAMLAATQKSGPPTLVSFLPAFWLLVPGALGLVGVTQYLGDERLDGVAALVTTGVTMIAIALGVLLGLAVGGGLASVARRAG
jgi:uncharacterized membrane protein YjjP (DUF1212 family)